MSEIPPTIEAAMEALANLVGALGPLMTDHDSPHADACGHLRGWAAPEYAKAVAAFERARRGGTKGREAVVIGDVYNTRRRHT